jgi:putative phosphotransacetylase
LEQEFIKNIAARVASQLLLPGRTIPQLPVIPTGVSNRHVHLSLHHMSRLFGTDLTKWRCLSQPGQYVAAETVILAGPKGTLEGVRVLGPAREQSQAELSASDAYKLGIPAVVRESGDLQGTPGITVIGPLGSVQLDEGVIIAKRHIHMRPEDAELFQVHDGDIVHVKADGERGLIFDQVVVRVNKNFKLDFHVDFEEANAAGLKHGDYVHIVHRMSSVGRTSEAGESQKTDALQTENKKGLTLITEETAKRALDQLYIQPGAIITPLARDVIKEKGIHIIYLK